MTALIVSIIGSVVAGAVLMALRMLLASRQSMGERIGRLERLNDIEEGYRKGLAEAKHNERDGGK